MHRRTIYKVKTGLNDGARLNVRNNTIIEDESKLWTKITRFKARKSVSQKIFRWLNQNSSKANSSVNAGNKSKDRSFQYRSILKGDDTRSGWKKKEKKPDLTK